MSDPRLTLLVITDLHYVKAVPNTCGLSRRRVEWGRLLLRKALLRMKHAGIRPDVLVLLGDLVNDGTAPGAQQDLEALADEARQSGLPLLALPGNHDGGTDLEGCFGCKPGLHEIGGYGFLVFRDEVGAGDVTTRREADVALPGRVAAEHPGLPLIALQHNPLHPRIESDYPYMPVNTAAILDSYRGAGVMLSLSGHYHPGVPCSKIGDTRYYVAPALCESPFRFSLITLNGREVDIREQALTLEAPGLTDVHCHSEYAYCGTTVNAKTNIEVSKALGLGRLCLTEHTFQLYFDKEDAWSFRWQTDGDMVRNAWGGTRGRMDDYRRFAAPLRSEFVSLGLEVDLLSDGRLLVAPEDLAGWDVIVGAVHEIPGVKRKQTPQEEAERLFMEQVEALLAQPIQVLAHPFRFFRRAGLLEPAHLYGWMAERLARAGVAAEINFHTNTNEPAFIRECVARGVRIALGSDSHDLAEVGEFYPHLEVLKQAGVSPDQYGDVLFSPVSASSDRPR
jgi:Icc protein